MVLDWITSPSKLVGGRLRAASLASSRASCTLHGGAPRDQATPWDAKRCYPAAPPDVVVGVEPRLEPATVEVVDDVVVEVASVSFGFNETGLIG